MTDFDHVPAALKALVGGTSSAEASAALNAVLGRSTAATCTHPDGCTNPATHQTQRDATPEEAAAHWDGLEQHIRAHGNPDYVQNRDDAVTVAEHRCDDPAHADPAHLEAVARQETTDA